MLIEAYFRDFGRTLETCLWVESSSVGYDKRSTHEGYVRGEIHFVDGSMLHVREFVDAEFGIDRIAYAYQYMDPSGGLVFRYDNSGHHRRLNLPTYPHHKHHGSEGNVVAAEMPDIEKVLQEIDRYIRWAA